jgi:predicted RNase H-like nuclease (RuvC/YqgF family)
MYSETRAAFAALSDQVTALDEKVVAGFARADRYFELQHQQHLELRGRVGALSERVEALTEHVAHLGHEVAQLRDYVTREIADIKFELRELRGQSGQTEELRREIAELTVRVDRLERRQSD